MQIYTGDRVGDYIMQGAQGLGAGIGGGLANMADAFAKAQEKKKQLAAQGKAADALVKSSPDLLKSLGMTPEDWALQSPTDKHAAVQGAMGAQAFAEGQQQGQERTLRMLEMERRLEAQDAEAANRGKAGSFFGELSSAMRPDAPEPGSEGPTRPGMDLAGAVAFASERSGYNPPASIQDNFINVLAKQHEPAKAPRGLPLGTVQPVDGIGSIVGTGEDFEPNFVPTPRPKPEDAPAPNYPWLFTDDKNVFTNNLLALDPKARDAAIAARKAYNAAIGRDDPLRDALAQLLGGKQPDKAGGGSPGPASTAPVGGTLSKGADGKYYFKP